MRPVGTPVPSLDVAVPAAAEADVAAVRDLVAGMFVMPPPSWPGLLARDRVLRDLVDRVPLIRVLTITDPLYALTRTITAQQVHLRFATTIRARLAELVGERFEVDGVTVRSIDPDRLAGTPVADLRALQFSERKAAYLTGVAAAVAAGRLDVPALAELDDDAVVAELTAMHGIGRWTAEWFLIRVLGRPAVAAGDVAVRRAVGRLYDAGYPTEPAVRQLTEHWGDAAHVAQQIVLETCAGPKKGE
jgi:3-methyladenine DNA glycosylase/8-oxoguanine DNA glycosylase